MYKISHNIFKLLFIIGKIIVPRPIKKFIYRKHNKYDSLLRNAFDIRKQNQKKFRKKIYEYEDTIVFGPFFSEVGYEVLYWFPYINYLISGKQNQKIIILSRGGLSKVFFPFNNIEHHCLINLLGKKDYVDFIKMSTGDYKDGLNQKGIIKNSNEELIQKLNLNSNKPLIVDPSKMFKFYKSYISKKVGIKSLNEFSNYDLYKNYNRLENTKKKYDLCIKLYDAPQLRFNDFVKKKIIKKINSLSNKKICILISNKYDDHEQIFLEKLNENIEKIKIPDFDNLKYQSEIISNSKTFITPYGGMSYLGPILGAKTICLVDNNFKWFYFSQPHFQKFVDLLDQIQFKNGYNLIDLEEFEKVEL